MNTKKKTMMQRFLSGVLVLLGFSACSDDDGFDNQVYMYGTIPVHFIRSAVTDANEKPIEGIRAVLEYKNMKGELTRDTTYTDAKGLTKQEPLGGMKDLENAKAKLTFEDIDGEKNGSYEVESVEFSVKEKYIDGDIVRVALKEKKE